MNDDELVSDWRMLEPTMDVRRRIDARVTDWLEAHDTSLAGEWLALFRVAPVRAVGLVAASALSMVVATPVMWLARALL